MFSRMYFFGDSLSDEGVIFQLTSAFSDIPSPTPQIGYSDSFTNEEPFGDGEVWTETAAQLLGLTDDQVHSFAVGGARAIGSRSLAGNFDDLEPDVLDAIGLTQAEFDMIYGAEVLTPEALARIPEDIRNQFSPSNNTFLTGQVTNAVAEMTAEGGPPPGSAATFLIGGNDYNNFDPSGDPNAFIDNLVNSILTNARAVADAGVDTLIYVTQPSITFAPISQILTQNLADSIAADLIADGADPEEAAATALNQARFAVAFFNVFVRQQNDRVTAGFEQIGIDTGVDVQIVDLAALTSALDEDRSGFGFSDSTGSRILGGTGLNEFVDLNNNGIPDLEFDIGSNTVTEEEEGPFLAFSADGSAPPTHYILFNPDGEGIENDELVFYDGLHPTAASHDIIGAFYDASLKGKVSLLEDSDDTIAERDKSEVIFGLDGNDKIQAGRGFDVVFGGLGNDGIDAGNGFDVVSGGAGSDFIFGGNGGDVLIGGDGSDWVVGGQGDDVIALGGGTNLGFGARGDDVFIFKPASDTEETSYANGGKGYDVVYIEVSGDDAAAAQQALDGFVAGDQFEFVLGDASITVLGVEEIIIGDRSDVEGAQSAYESAFARTDPRTIDEAISVAALWNLTDPIRDADDMIV